MKVLRTAAAAVAIGLLAGGQLAASFPVAFYGIIERVVFEPDAASPERVQVWGVFAYADRVVPDSGVSDSSPVERGYLYFTLPDYARGAAASSEVDPVRRERADLVRREWADLASVAGTGQAVAFGRWAYWGPFADLHPGRPGEARFSSRLTGDGTLTVRPPSAPLVSPVMYHTNAGIVKLSDRGSHAEIVSRLRAKLVTKAVD